MAEPNQYLMVPLFGAQGLSDTYHPHLASLQQFPEIDQTVFLVEATLE